MLNTGKFTVSAVKLEEIPRINRVRMYLIIDSSLIRKAIMPFDLMHAENYHLV